MQENTLPPKPARRPADHVTVQSQHTAVSCGQTCVAMALNAMTGSTHDDMWVDQHFGFSLMTALQSEDPKGGWKDRGNLTGQDVWDRTIVPVLKAGYPVILGVNGPEFSPSSHGHIILLTGLDAHGAVHVADPNRGRQRVISPKDLLAAPDYPGGKFIFAPTLPK